jgi:hypothetical protein
MLFLVANVTKKDIYLRMADTACLVGTSSVPSISDAEMFPSFPFIKSPHPQYNYASKLSKALLLQQSISKGSKVDAV